MMPACTVRLDRVQFVCRPQVGTPRLPTIAELRVLRDSFVRCQTTAPTYARCRQLESLNSGTKVYWQYQRRRAWLMPWRITFVGNDHTGLTAEDIDPVLVQGRQSRLLLMELALDFDASSGVDESFVMRHGLFGKSRYVSNRGGPEALRYGSRKSAKLVRCYAKSELSVFRVELELHGSLLRENQVSIELPNTLLNIVWGLVPEHVRFIRFDWRRLRRHLRKKLGKRSGLVFRHAKRRAWSIQQVGRYLRRHGIANVHRFYRPLAINAVIQGALDRWAKGFRRGMRWASAV